MDEKVTRCTAIECQGVRIYTIEHLMAALSGMGIDNVTIEIDAEEVPGMDGSSLEFVKAIEQVGTVEGQADRNIFTIQEPIVVSNKNSTIVMVPHDQLNISYTLNYDHPLLNSQFFSQSIDSASFAKELASARTFCLESEVNEIKAKGLALGLIIKIHWSCHQKARLRMHCVFLMNVPGTRFWTLLEIYFY